MLKFSVKLQFSFTQQNIVEINLPTGHFAGNVARSKKQITNLSN